MSRKQKLGVRICITIILSVVIGLSVMSTGLRHQGYQLSFGWEQPEMPKQAAKIYVTCDRPLNTDGFPLAEKRPYYDTCRDSYNRPALIINKAVYLTLAIAIVICIGRSLRRLKGLPK